MNLRTWLMYMGLICLTSLQFAYGEDAPGSCQETTERVLKPFLDRLAAAEEAAKQYEAQNAEKIKWINEQIQIRRDAQTIFDEAKAEENETYGNRIKWGHEAITEARADAQKRIAQNRKLAADARAKGRESQAKSYTAAANQIAANLAADKLSWYKKELQTRHTIKGWQDYGVQQTQNRAERMAAYAAGKVSHYIKTLQWRATWQGVLSSIVDKKEELRKASQREYSYYMKAIQTRLSGEGMDSHVKKRQDELADARHRIAAGTFGLYVRVLQSRTDRNGVQKLMAEARNKYRKTVNAWSRKTYRCYNTLLHGSVTNGYIEKTIAQKRLELAEFQAAGEEAVVYAAGGRQSARAIRQRILKAQGQGLSNSVKNGQVALAAWKKAHGEWIAAKQKEIQRWEDILKQHKKHHAEDLTKQKAYMDGHLSDALDQTPCGGAGGAIDPNAAVVERHHNQLDKLSESEEEKKRRRDWYDDKVHVDRDGTVHGNPSDAWEHALQDTGVGSKPEPSFAEWLLSVQSILDSKNFADWLMGFRDAKKMREATAQIDEFIKAMESIDIGTMKNADFFKRRKEIRQMLGKVSGALEGGLLSPSRIQQYMDALRKSGSGTRQTREQLKMLQKLLNSSQDAKSMLRSTSALRSIASSLTRNVAESYKTFVSGSAAQVAKRLDQSYASMTKLDKGLLVLSVASAAAEAADLMAQGKAPSDAIARSSVNLAIDMAIANIPITAAAEMITQIMFSSYAYIAKDKAVADATLSNVTKLIAQKALDQVASGAAYLGDVSIAFERMVFNEPNIDQILGNVSYPHLRQSLSHVEDKLAAIPPGHADEKRLLRIREAFRILIRAKQKQVG